MLEAAATPDPLLDTDAPALHSAWLRREDVDALIGTEVSGHRIVEVLGEGGSATVYRAEGEGSVASKVLKPEACSPGLSRQNSASAPPGSPAPGTCRSRRSSF